MTKKNQTIGNKQNPPTTTMEHYLFGTDANNENSLQNWIAWLADQQDQTLIQTEKENKISLLNDINFYVPDNDIENYPLYLEGIWRQVAYFNERARNRLLAVYQGNSAFKSNLILITPEKTLYTMTHFIQ